MKKYILNILIIFLLTCSYSSLAQELNQEKKITLKKITEASYSPKRTGKMSREEALTYSRVKDKFYNEQGFINWVLEL